MFAWFTTTTSIAMEALDGFSSLPDLDVAQHGVVEFHRSGCGRITTRLRGRRKRPGSTGLDLLRLHGIDE